MYLSPTGISGMRITAKDIAYAREMGCDIKLIGMTKNTEDGIEAYVCPMLIPSSHPLASVNDSYNAVFVRGDAVGNAMFFGRGAGELRGGLLGQPGLRGLRHRDARLPRPRPPPPGARRRPDSTGPPRTWLDALRRPATDRLPPRLSALAVC